MEKIRELFAGMIVKKDNKNDQFSILGIPSFIRDWFIRRYANENGEINTDFVASKIKEILPRKENVNQILDKLYQGENVKFLAKIEVNIDLKKTQVSFAINDLDIDFKDTIITPDVWEECKDYVLNSNGGVWGIVTLCVRRVKLGKSEENKIALLEFKNFMPYTIDLNYYKKARTNFSTEEWIDVVLSAIDYNA
ncbi:MAG: ATP-dependent protease, partial [Clostridia bacterium]|nr:ATP-dependent protease [Clostridia bacterium]